MQVQLETLVFWILVAVTLAGLMTVGFAIYGITQESADISCLASVGIGAFGAQISHQIDIDLRGCETRYTVHEADASDREVRKEIVDDMTWCYRSFGGQADLEVMREAGTFCHVCAIHQRDGGQNVTGVQELFEQRMAYLIDLGDPEEPGTEFQLGPDLQDIFEQATQPQTQLAMDQPVAIMFVQELDEDYTWLGRLLGTNDLSASEGAGIATGLAGAIKVAEVGYTVVSFVSAPATGGTSVVVAAGVRTGTKTFGRAFLRRYGPTIARGTLVISGFFWGKFLGEDTIAANGILIRPYNEQAIQELGCTTIDPSPE